VNYIGTSGTKAPPPTKEETVAQAEQRNNDHVFQE